MNIITPSDTARARGTTRRSHRHRLKIAVAAAGALCIGGAGLLLASEQDRVSVAASPPSVATTVPTTPSAVEPATTAPIDSTAPAAAPVTTVGSAPAEPPPSAEQTDEAATAELPAPTITQIGARPDRPTHPEPAPEAPTTFDVALEVLDHDAVDEAAPSPPVDIPAVPVGTPGDLSSNAVGCASDCIVSALIRRSATAADIDVEVATNVATRTRVWISTRRPRMVGGVPVFPGRPPAADSKEATEQWTAHLDGLQYSTTYHLIVRVDDLYGHRQYATTEFDTIDAPPGDLAGNGDGCYYRCIESAFVASGNHNAVEIVATASVPADFNFAVSTSAPGSIGDTPLLPNDQPVEVLQQNSKAIRVEVSALQPDTLYHAVLTVTDEDGFTDHAVGQFRTPKPPPRVPVPTDVLISFERITVVYDGDAGKHNRGELEFRWGFKDAYEYIGSRSEEKLNTGDTVDLPAGTGGWVSVPSGGSLPNLIVIAAERDADGRGELCAGASGLDTYPRVDDGCDSTYLPAMTGPIPLSAIDAMANCSVFGFSGDAALDKCTVIQSIDFGEEFARVFVVVRLHRG
jgi:hypothetical protein